MSRNEPGNDPVRDPATNEGHGAVRTLVLGGAVSGRAAVRLASSLGHDVTVYDRDAAAVSDLPAGVSVVSGEWNPSTLAGVDLVVTSPGIPQQAPPLRDAMAGTAPLVSELEFAASHLAAPYVAVTGTNGKTTVTEATAAMFTASGLRSCAAGNVGLALSDVALDETGNGSVFDAVAVEASSFQLRLIDRFHPAAAAVLNVAPDHLDWHGGFAAYASAKGRIFENQTGDDIAVHGADDDVASGLAAASRGRHVPVSGTHRPANGNGPEGDVLHIGDDIYPRPELDPVWTFDLAVAATLARHAGATPDGIATVLEQFRPGLHRRTVVAVSDGVTWVNDSKATNPHAAVASAGAYPSVVLIAGGRNKGLDLSPLLRVPTLRHVLALGEAAADLAAIGGSKVTVVDDMDDAVCTAAGLAHVGDTVLLAPGCASFDMFDSYGQRGEVFSTLVQSLVARNRSEAGEVRS